MCAPSPPGAKAATAAAQAQGEANVEAARATAQLNNPNVYSPYGSQTVSYNGDIPTVTQQFSPEQQGLYDQQVQVKDLLGKLGIQGATSLQDILGKSFDFSGAPEAPGAYRDVRNKVIRQMMGRYDQEAGRRTEDATSTLIAQGLRPGTEAFDDAMTRFDQQRNDYRGSAETAAAGHVQQAYGMDADRRRQYISELISQRQLPLNEIIGLMSGSQVENPFAQAGVYQGGAVVQPAPMTLPFEAQMNAHNADAANYGGMMSGLFGLGSAGITGYYG